MNKFSPNTRALVVGGGGAAGNAWALGLIAGLAEGGVDVTEADLVVGTSSGSTVAAQITGGTSPAGLYTAILSEVPPAAGNYRFFGRAHLDRTNELIAAAADASDMRRRIGAAAMEMAAPDAWDHWRRTVEARFTAREWPERPNVKITSVDARTGEPVVFDRDSGVDLVHAVAASSSNGFGPGDDRYVNGAYRRGENADLATGFGRVLVLSPFSGRSRTRPEWGMDLATQVEELRAGGSRVETVFPDARAGDVFDAGALDPSTRLPAARGGYEQGLALAEPLREFGAERTG